MPAEMGDRWSFGSASTLETAVGVLSVTALIVGAGRATLDASLLPSAGGSLSGMIEQTHNPVDVVFGLEPVPADGHAWYELRSAAGDSLRLQGATRAAGRPGVAVPRADRGNSGMPPGHDDRQPGDGGQFSDGPPLQLDIATALPAVDGTAVQVDTLISQPWQWLVYLRARLAWVERSPMGGGAGRS